MTDAVQSGKKTKPSGRTAFNNTHKLRKAIEF